jgi:hypothetical protein
LDPVLDSAVLVARNPNVESPRGIGALGYRGDRI